MNKPRPKKPVLFPQSLRHVVLRLFVVFGIVFGLGLSIWGGVAAVDPHLTGAATNNTVNFQARLLKSNGALSADGYYNIEFKLYNVSSGGSALWTEDYLNSGSTGVRVANGYISVALGSQTAFPTSINWNQDLYLTMNIGGTGNSASWDGEMTPRLHLTATPYSMSAGQLSYYDGTNSTTVNFATQTASNTITIPNASGTLCLQSSSSCGFAPGTASSYIQNGTSQQASSNFNISGTGVANLLQASGFDSKASNALTIGGTNATSITVGNASSSTGTSFISQNGAGAFQVLNASSLPVLSVNTSTNKITVGNISTTAGQPIQGSLLFGDGTTDGYAANLISRTLTANQTIYLPNASGTICLSTGNCPAAGGSGNYIQTQ